MFFQHLTYKKRCILSSSVPQVFLTFRIPYQTPSSKLHLRNPLKSVSPKNTPIITTSPTQAKTKPASPNGGQLPLPHGFRSTNARPNRRNKPKHPIRQQTNRQASTKTRSPRRTPSLRSPTKKWTDATSHGLWRPSTHDGRRYAAGNGQ